MKRLMFILTGILMSTLTAEIIHVDDDGGLSSIQEGIDHGYIRMVVDRHPEAVEALRAAGYLVLERDIVLLELSNRPGSLMRTARRWADAEVNLEYAYCANGPDIPSGFVVARLSDPERGLAALDEAAK